MNAAQQIDINKLVSNQGQIQGLPANPRLIKDNKYEKLKNSLIEDPEMLELRELIVFPHGNQFVVICGNMRLQAMKELNYKDAPCKVLDKNTPEKKLRAYTIKDNVGYGSDNWDMLANEWDPIELEDWGMEIPDIEEQQEEKQSAAPDDKLTLKFTPDMMIDLHTAIDKMSNSDEFKYAEYHDDDKAKAIWLICKEYINERR